LVAQDLFSCFLAVVPVPIGIIESIGPSEFWQIYQVQISCAGNLRGPAVGRAVVAASCEENKVEGVSPQGFFKECGTFAFLGGVGDQRRVSGPAISFDISLVVFHSKNGRL